MNPYRMAPPPKWWPPKLSPTLMRPIKTRRRLREQRLMDVTVHGTEPVREAVDSGQGVLITPNHASHADSFTITRRRIESAPLSTSWLRGMRSQPGLLTRFLLRAVSDTVDCVCARDSILNVQEARLRSNLSALLATAPLTTPRYEIW